MYTQGLVTVLFHDCPSLNMVTNILLQLPSPNNWKKGVKKQDKQVLSLNRVPGRCIHHLCSYSMVLNTNTWSQPSICKRGQEVESLAEQPLRLTVPLQGRKEQQCLLFYLVLLLLFYCWLVFAWYTFPFGQCFTVSPFTFILCSHILCVSSSN